MSHVSQIFALLLGLAFVYVGNGYRALAQRMRTYRSVPGRVVAREVVLAPTGNTRTGRYGDGGGYTPQVTYRYVVDGAGFTSNKIAASIPGYKRAVAERKLEAIPDAVVVWYDPKDPTQAYLTRHGPALGWVILVLGAGLAAGAVLSLAT